MACPTAVCLGTFSLKYAVPQCNEGNVKRSMHRMRTLHERHRERGGQKRLIQATLPRLYFALMHKIYQSALNTPLLQKIGRLSYFFLHRIVQTCAEYSKKTPRVIFSSQSSAALQIHEDEVTKGNASSGQREPQVHTNQALKNIFSYNIRIYIHCTGVNFTGTKNVTIILLTTSICTHSLLFTHVQCGNLYTSTVRLSNYLQCTSDTTANEPVWRTNKILSRCYHEPMGQGERVATL